MTKKKLTKMSLAASAMAKARWRGVSAEERSRETSRVASTLRTAKRCFCGKESMWTAAQRYFDCCRKAGVITLNFELKKELERNERTKTGTNE